MQASSIYLILAIYFVFGTLIAFYARKGLGRGMADYFLAKRMVSGIVAALTYSATTYRAFMMVGLAVLTYTGGVGAWRFELIYLSGLGFMPGIWSAVISTAVFIFISLLTSPPAKAEEFLDYINKSLKEKKAI